MKALILFFIELCAMRRGPQDLPAAPLLLALMAIASLLTGLLIGLVAGLPLGSGLTQSLAELALTLGALYAALRLLGRDARFLQAATALLGAGVLIGLLAVVPLSLNPTGSQETDLAALGALMLLALVVWSLVVTGHILRHTFEITLGQGVAVAVAFKISTLILIGSLFRAA
ncbi:MAG: hypothetical protein EOM91_09425 [Sphingobacteriia bacterium]|nr:hypothetical protein [Sphingobacteriia bacterium]NCC38980.1 hypothetical protein [Gammaproteobacteria bacterium]